MENTTLPTEKQIKALNGVALGKSVSKAMLDAGYSEATSRNPSNLTKSKGWSEMIEKYLPDNKLASLHKELLNKKEIIVVSDGAKEGSHLEWTGQPHTDALKALDLAHKLKGRYSEEGGGNKTLIVLISGESNSRYATQSLSSPDSN